MPLRAALFTVLLALQAPALLRAQAGSEAYKRGRAALTAGKYDDAVGAFEQAVKADGASAEYHLWLGNALGSVAQRANVFRQPFLARRVKSEFERTVQLDSTSIGAHEGLLEFYRQAPGVMGGSMDRARAEAGAIGRINALRGHFARASLAREEKDSAAVEREYRAALDAFPDSLSAVTALSAYLLSTRRGDDAFPLLEAYLSRHPTDMFAQFWIGRTSAITGHQLDRGERALRTVLAAPGIGIDTTLPPPANAHYRLGDIAAKRGDKVRAKEEYEAALRLNPTLEAARKALAAL